MNLRELQKRMNQGAKDFYKDNLERWTCFARNELELDEKKFEHTIKWYEEDNVEFFNEQTQKDKYAAIVAKSYLHCIDQGIFKHLNTLAGSKYFTKDYLEKKIQLDDKNQNCTLAELAAKTNNHPTLIKLQELGVNLESIKPIVNEETVEKCLEKVKAQYTYKERLSKNTEFTFSVTGQECKKLIDGGESLVKYLDEKQKEKYTSILQNTFWKYASQDVNASDHLTHLLASPSFKISEAKKDNKPLLHAVIDFANDKNNLTPLHALLEQKEILATINTAVDGILPADRALLNKNTLRVLVEHNALHNCEYNKIKHITDSSHLFLIFKSHQNRNQLAAQAIQNSDYDFLLKLKSYYPDLPIWKTINIENEIYYKDYLSKIDQLTPNALSLNKKDNFKNLIANYDQKFDSLDEKKKSHYRAILLNTLAYCASEDTDPSDHLTILLASPYAKENLQHAKMGDKPLLHAAIDRCIVTKNDATLRALLEIKDIHGLINTPAFNGLLPADRAIQKKVNKHVLKLLVDNEAQNNCTYEQLKNIIKDINDEEHLRLIFKSHKDLSKLVESAANNLDHNFLLKLKQYDENLLNGKDLSDIELQEKRKIANTFYYRQMIKPDSNIFNEEEVYKTFDVNELKDLETVRKKYDEHAFYFTPEQKQNYAALLANTYHKIHSEANIYSKNNLEILTQSPHFSPNTILSGPEKTPLLHATIWACFTRQSAYEPLDVLLAHKDIQPALEQRNEEKQLPADLIINNTTLLKKLVAKGAKNSATYTTLTQLIQDKENLRLILRSHQDINAVDEKTGFTFAEQAMLDRNYELLVELNNEDANIERALALGGPNAIDELLKLGPTRFKKTTIKNDTSLREKLKHYQKNRTELRVDFCDIVSTIISSKNTEALEKIATQDKFKEKLLAFIRELPEDTQDYIFALSRIEGTDATAFNKIWKKARGSFFTHALGFSEKQPTKETGVYKEILEEAKKRGKKEVFSLSSAELQQKERIDKLKKDIATQKAKLQKTSATNPDLEQKIECNEEEKINSRKLSDVEKVISNGKTQQIIDQFNKTRENKENWGYTFAIAGKKHLEAFKKNVPDTLGTVDLTLLLEDALTNEKENFKKLVDDIQNKKVSPDMLKEIISLYPDFPSRVLSSLKDYYTPKQEYQLLVDALTQPKKSPFAPIWPGNSAQGEQRKARDRMKELNKLLSLKESLKEKEVKYSHLTEYGASQKVDLIEKFTKLHNKYDEHKDEKADSVRLKAKVKVCSDCLDFLINGKALPFESIETWEESYKKDNIHNVFKQGSGKGFIILENDLAEEVRTLFRHRWAYAWNKVAYSSTTYNSTTTEGCEDNLTKVTPTPSPESLIITPTPSAPQTETSMYPNITPPNYSAPPAFNPDSEDPISKSEKVNLQNDVARAAISYSDAPQQSTVVKEPKKFVPDTVPLDFSEPNFASMYPNIDPQNLAQKVGVSYSSSSSTTGAMMSFLAPTALQNLQTSSVETSMLLDAKQQIEGEKTEIEPITPATRGLFTGPLIKNQTEGEVNKLVPKTISTSRLSIYNSDSEIQEPGALEPNEELVNFLATPVPTHHVKTTPIKEVAKTINANLV